MKQNKTLTFPTIIRKLLFSWVTAAALEYTFSRGLLADLNTLAAMSLPRLGIITALIFLLLLLFSKSIEPWIERWGMVISFSWLAGLSLYSSFTIPFLFACCLVLAIMLCYAVRGWNCEPLPAAAPKSEKRHWIIITAIAAIGFFIFVSAWTVYRVLSFSTPTYDFGIFSQMFYNMKESGLPMTTLERDGLLSHFHVHMSPIYYLLLPLYYLFPTPATLQVLQAAILASAVIPLWLLGKQHGLKPAIRTLLCAALVLYPAYAGGTSYDIHENAFLTPLILWLLYALDSKKHLLTGLFTLLVLAVKEDAAVYTAVIALYVIIRSRLIKELRNQFLTGALMLITSIGWFFAVTDYLANIGDGVMTYRYDNFIYDGSSSLITVIKAIILCPMKAVFECFDAEKLTFIGYTLLPLLGLPLLTRRFERYLLLIPYILVNLMSDYQYQHDIFFQYTYGSTACAFYLVVVNLADIKSHFSRFIVQTASVAVCAVCFIGSVIPKAQPYFKNYIEHREYYRQIEQALDLVPEDASVCATTFYTTYLSQREELYDVRYATTEHLLDCEYIVLTTKSESCYKAYAVNGENGLAYLIRLLEQNGYTQFAQLDGTLVIYRKS